jgi:hypothetical protein
MARAPAGRTTLRGVWATGSYQVTSVRLACRWWPRPGPTGQPQGTKPEDRRVRPSPQPPRGLPWAAAARVDRSGTGHSAGGIRGQTLTATTTGIIAAESPSARWPLLAARLAVCVGLAERWPGRHAGSPEPAWSAKLSGRAVWPVRRCGLRVAEWATGPQPAGAGRVGPLDRGAAAPGRGAGVGERTVGGGGCDQPLPVLSRS